MTQTFTTHLCTCIKHEKCREKSAHPQIFSALPLSLCGDLLQKMHLVGCHRWINKSEQFQVKNCEEAEGEALHCQLLPSEWGQSSPVSLSEHNPGGAAQGRLTLELKVCCKPQSLQGNLGMLEAFAGGANPLANAYLHELLQQPFFLTNFLHAEIWPNACRNQIQGNASTQRNTLPKEGSRVSDWGAKCISIHNNPGFCLLSA